MSSGAIIRKIVYTAAGPRPIGPYNQAVVVDRTVYVSGVLGVDKETGKLVDGGIANEADQVLKNLGKILEAADSSYDNVVKNTILLNDIKDFATVNEVYKKYFTKNFPARSTYQVAALPFNANIEIESIAITGPLETATPKL